MGSFLAIFHITCGKSLPVYLGQFSWDNMPLRCAALKAQLRCTAKVSFI